MLLALVLAATPPPPAALVVLEPEVEEKTLPARVATPTTYWKSQVPAPAGTKVLALCGDKLVASTLTVKRNADSHAADDDEGRFDVAVKGCDAAFFVVGDAGVKAGAVKATAKAAKGLGRVDLTGGGSLRREGNNERYELVFDDMVHKRTTILVEGRAPDDAHVDVLFVGDLNGDGNDDVVVDAARHYNVTTVRLFLSDASGQLRQVALHTTTGC